MPRRVSVLFYSLIERSSRFYTLVVFVPLIAGVILYFCLQDQSKILNAVAFILPFVVAEQLAILFEFWKAHRSRADDAAFQAKLETCDNDTRELIEALLTTFPNGYIDKLKSLSTAISENMSSEIRNLRRQVRDWKMSYIETTPSAWLSFDVQLVERAKLAIEATSYGQLDFWNSDKGQSYLDRNLESSAPTKRRIFILTEQEERDIEKMAALEKTLRRHIEGKIDVKIRIVGPMEYLEDFAIFDGQVLSRTEGGHGRTRIYWDDAADGMVEQYKKKFDGLFDEKESRPVVEWLQKLQKSAAPLHEYRQGSLRPRSGGGRGRNR
jgi:hypothetical protein